MRHEEVDLEAIDRLKEVQRISGKISLYLSEIAKHEKKLNSALADQQLLRGQLEPIESRLGQGQIITRKLELDSKVAEDKIQKNRKQLDQATQATEFSGLKEQLARFDEEKAAVDESLIMVLEKIDELRTQEGDLNQRIAQAEEQLDEIRTEVTANTHDYRNELESLHKPLQQARVITDDELLEEFDRLFPSLGATVVVTLDGSTCGGCHLNVSSQVGEKVQAGKEVVICPSCARFLS